MPVPQKSSNFYNLRVTEEVPSMNELRPGSYTCRAWNISARLSFGIAIGCLPVYGKGCC